jgi:DNA-binding protein HU-beta
VNRTELISAVAAKTDLGIGQVDSVIAALQGTLIETVGKGEKLTLPGLFTLERTERAERKGRNPRTGEPLIIPAQFAVKITPGSALRAAVRA